MRCATVLLRYFDWRRPTGGDPALRSSLESSDKNSSKARWPASFAAVSDWKPSSVSLTPRGMLLRWISQRHRSGRSPLREVVTKYSILVIARHAINGSPDAVLLFRAKCLSFSAGAT